MTDGQHESLCLCDVCRRAIEAVDKVVAHSTEGVPEVHVDEMPEWLAAEARLAGRPFEPGEELVKFDLGDDDEEETP